MKSKRCTGCEQLKPIKEFSKQHTTKDRLRYKCKSCLAMKHKEYYQKNKAGIAKKKAVYYRENSGEITEKVRQYYTGNKEEVIKRVRKYQIANPEKQRARKAVGYAIEKGRLVVPSVCSGCGEGGKLDAHHEDYSDPLEVKWLCRSCHRRRHSEITLEGEKK